MRTFLIAFSLSLMLSLFLTPMIRNWALRMNLYDSPSGGRKIHKAPIPRLGGLAIMLSMSVPLLGLSIWDNSISQQFLGEEVSGSSAVGADEMSSIQRLASATELLELGEFDQLKEVMGSGGFANDVGGNGVMMGGGGMIQQPHVGSTSLDGGPPFAVNELSSIQRLASVTELLINEEELWRRLQSLIGLPLQHPPMCLAVVLQR